MKPFIKYQYRYSVGTHSICFWISLLFFLVIIFFSSPKIIQYSWFFSAIIEAIQAWIIALKDWDTLVVRSVYNYFIRVGDCCIKVYYTFMLAVWENVSLFLKITLLFWNYSWFFWLLIIPKIIPAYSASL